MAKIVVDASVLIAVVTNEATKASLVALTQEADLIAPHPVHWEIGNAFSAMLKRKNITLDQAQVAIAAYQHIPVRFVDIKLETALKIAHAENIYAYDAYLICCAAKYQTPLLTLDRELVNAAKSAGVKVLEV